MTTLNALKTLIFFLSWILIATTAHARCVGGYSLTTTIDKWQVNGDGTVSHTGNALMWQRCSVGQDTLCEGEAIGYTWENALAYVNDVNRNGGFAGFMDWRLPNIKELQSLAEYSCINPAIPHDIFPNTPPVIFWSSTIQTKGLTTQASWLIDFRSGRFSPGSRTEIGRIRLVRGG